MKNHRFIMKKTFLLITVLFVNFLLYSQEDQNISNGIFYDGEPYIAINPNNSQHFVVAWMSTQFLQNIVIRSKVSFDAGTSWSEPTFFEHSSANYTSADVSIQFDLQGNVFAAYVDYDSEEALSGAVYLRKSSDGGLNWNTPIEVIAMTDCPDKLCIDRPWMVINQSNGDETGNIYITTMNAAIANVTPPYNPYLTISTDQGASFQSPIILDEENYLAGNLISQPMPSPTVGADGELHVMFPSYLLSQNIFPQFIQASVSNNGLEINHQIAWTGSTGITDNLSKKGSLLKANPVDPFHLIFLFLKAESNDPDIYLIETFDKGETWSDPLRINDDSSNNGKMQDLVWADFDSDGDLSICWRDRREASDNGYETPSRIYGTVRWIDSLDFEPNFMVAAELADHNVILNGSGNDFMCMEFENDTLNAVWGDTRTGVLSIYLSRFSLIDNTVSTIEITQEKTPEIIGYPNPCTSLIHLLNVTPNNSFIIQDQIGNIVKRGEIENNGTVDISSLADGSYYLQFLSGNSPIIQFIKTE